jgi:CRP/FNR family cyclic AMP-dependent transcriptional regulator
MPWRSGAELGLLWKDAMSIVHANERIQSCFGVIDTMPLLSRRINRNVGRSIHSRTLMFPGGCGEPIGRSSNAGVMEKLENVGRLNPYPARVAIFQHGDLATSVYIVRHGKLKLSLNSRRGRCVVFRFAVAGDVLGFSAVLNQTNHEFRAETLEPSILVNVPRKEFLQLLQTSPEVNSFATQALARDHEAMLRGIRRLGLSASVRERLAQLLLMCLEFPRGDCLPMSIRMNWTNGELAEMVNSSRETVNRTMREFEREELITRRGSLLVIRNQARLNLLAG